MNDSTLKEAIENIGEGLEDFTQERPNPRVDDLISEDRDDEPSVLFTKDGFQTFEVLGGGSQDWRVVSLMVTKDALFWESRLSTLL